MPRLCPKLPITVVIPAFDAESYISAALQSVRAQSSAPAEIIVVDDGSRDRTAALAQGFGARVVRLGGNLGPAAARNAGARAAGEPWIAFLDADDIWRRDKLATQWQAITRWPDAGFCFTDYDVVGPSGSVCLREMACDEGYALGAGSDSNGAAVRFERGRLAGPLMHSMFIRQSSVVIRRDLVLRGGYDERLRLSEDYDFFLRAVSRAPAIAIERSLVIYNRREHSLSVDPLAEVSSIDRLWTSIIKEPARYADEVVRSAELRRPALLRMGCRIALRLGRFAEAIAFARTALTVTNSTATLLLFAAASVLNNGAGRACFRGGRALWRLRNAKWNPSACLRSRPPAQPPVERAHVIARHEPLFP